MIGLTFIHHDWPDREDFWTWVGQFQLGNKVMEMVVRRDSFNLCWRAGIPELNHRK